MNVAVKSGNVLIYQVTLGIENAKGNVINEDDF